MGKLKHGYARRGRQSRTYLIWHSMRARCRYPSTDSYPLYGGRGIRVCNRWQDFQNFLDDMGEAPERHSVDRINPDGDYEPGNCRWVTMKTQQRNRRRHHLLTFRGTTKTISEWAEELGIAQKTLRARIVDHGWDTERALTTPLRGRK